MNKKEILSQIQANYERKKDFLNIVKGNGLYEPFFYFVSLCMASVFCHGVLLNFFMILMLSLGLTFIILISFETIADIRFFRPNYNLFFDYIGKKYEKELIEQTLIVELEHIHELTIYIQILHNNQVFSKSFASRSNNEYDIFMQSLNYIELIKNN